MTKELKRLKGKLGKDLVIIRPNGTTASINTLCNSAKIDKKISTKLVRV